MARQYAALTATPFLSAHPFQRTDAANQRAMGLDILSSPVLAGTIRRSMQSGQSEASPAIRLVQEVGQQKAVALYQAVYGPSDAMQHQVLRGVISSLFRMDDIVQCHPAAWHAP
jgi:CHASE1-domain containing sensor protein